MNRMADQKFNPYIKSRYCRGLPEAAMERASSGSTMLVGDGGVGRIVNRTGAQAKFEAEKPDGMKKNVRMISGCEDAQTAGDVSNVQSFSLHDPAGM